MNPSFSHPTTKTTTIYLVGRSGDLARGLGRAGHDAGERPVEVGRRESVGGPRNLGLEPEDVPVGGRAGGGRGGGERGVPPPAVGGGVVGGRRAEEDGLEQGGVGRRGVLPVVAVAGAGRGGGGGGGEVEEGEVGAGAGGDEAVRVDGGAGRGGAGSEAAGVVAAGVEE